eukprot:symbB.v1.2.019427.t1/scaffold1589.1/size119216/3
MTDLSVALVEELEGRDDDADWEIEDWSKDHVVQQLRALQTNTAQLSQEDDEVRLSLSSLASTSVIDLSPGVAAHFAEDGALVFLSFNLLDTRAARRLALAKSQELTPRVLSYKMALVYVIARWQSASENQAAVYFNARAVRILVELQSKGIQEARTWLLQAEAIDSAVLRPP